MVPAGPPLWESMGHMAGRFHQKKKSIWVVPVGKSERAARPRPFQQGLVAYGN